MRRLTRAPITPFDITGRARPPLSTAIAKLKLEVKGLGTDITHGTEFYTPIVTLLARTLHTRRQDLVMCAWPLLGCPFMFYDSQLPDQFREKLYARMARENKAACLHEIVDFLQSVGKWDVKFLVEFVRAVEVAVAHVTGLAEQLQAAADAVRERRDREGMEQAAPGLSEGIVIPADGIGRVN